MEDENYASECLSSQYTGICPGCCRTEMGGSTAPRSVEEGAAGIVWLAADAPQSKTGFFWRDMQVIPW